LAEAGRVVRGFAAALVVLLLKQPVTLAQSFQPSEPAQSPEALAASGTPLVASGTPAKAARRFELDNRPTLWLSDSFRISLRARLQADARDRSRAFERDDSAFELAKRRIGIDGELFNRISFELEREIASGRPWRDVFTEVKIGKPLQVQIGRFKMPFSAEQLTSIVELPFIERSLIASILAPGRDTGIMIHGRVRGRRLSYQVGRFRQDGDAARRGSLEGAGQTVAGRVTTSAGVKHLTLGVGATSGWVPEGLNGLPGRTSNGFRFFEPVYVKGRRLRLGAEAGWHHDRYQVDAEWLQLRDERRGQGLGDVDLSAAVARGWYVSGSRLLRQGTRHQSGRRTFFDRGAGDLEVAARVEQIVFGSVGRADLPFRQPRAEHLFESRVRVATVGVNWYLNRWVKMLSDLSRESFSDPERRPHADRDHEWRWAIRLQWAM
jgi:phosphate-selective porin